jgi:hypothetical protein
MHDDRDTTHNLGTAEKKNVTKTKNIERTDKSAA